MTYENGRPVITEQAVSVKKQPLADSEFEAPAGYKKLAPRAFFEQENNGSMEEERNGMDNSSSSFMPEEQPGQGAAFPELPAGHAPDSPLPQENTKKATTPTVDNELKDKIKQGLRGLFGN